MAITRKLLIFLTAFILLPVLIGKALLMYTDWLWFGEVGYQSVYLKILLTRLELFAAFAALWFAVLQCVWGLTRRLGSHVPAPVAGRIIPLDDKLMIDRYMGKAITLTAAGISFLAGLLASARYAWYLKSLQFASFSQIEPVFHKDAAFYVFQLPWWNFVYQSFFTAVVIAFLGSVLLFVYDDAIQFTGDKLYIAPPALTYMGFLFAAMVCLKIVGYQFSAWNLVLSEHDLFTGANYTDVVLRLPILRGMMAVAALAGIGFFAACRRGNLASAMTLYGAYLAVGLLASGLVPSLFQKLIVGANELQWERPYLATNIKLTRFAYDLDRIVEKGHPAYQNLTEAVLSRNQSTLKNVRVWDKRVLETYRQLQEIRPYYNFLDVDIDRYKIDNENRQVMLAVRELSYDKLQTDSWINYHLKYTHGFGLCMSPVNESDQEGLPQFFIRDLPPRVSPGLPFRIEQPEIYFGEWTSPDTSMPETPAPPTPENENQEMPQPSQPVPGGFPQGGNPLASPPAAPVEVPYAIVDTTTKEFDYPSGDSNVSTIYHGHGGIPLNSLLRRVACALRFSSLQILVSRYLTPESRIIFNRSVVERARAIAPFLRYDSDAYPVIVQSRVYWIIDAYTTSLNFPYSQQTWPLGNYFRNSVKVVVDAYNGTTTFYRADNITSRVDPLLETYARIFPGLFKSLSEMPEDLKVHLRYPQGLFTVQANMYTRYHMTNVDTFFTDEDRWELPRIFTEVGQSAAKETMRPLYVTMKPPGMERTQFMLIMPFTARGRDNMRSWLTVNCDTPGYGEMVVYVFPKKQNVYGPAQVQALINQNERISQNLTLWGRHGSQVIWGSLQVVPIAESLLYIQPLYLQAESTQIPELKRVIVTYGDVVAMADRFDDALGKVIALSASPGSSTPLATTRTVQPVKERKPEASVRSLVTQANDHFQRSLAARKTGDWETYGKELDKVGQTLRELQSQNR